MDQDQGQGLDQDQDLDQGQDHDQGEDVLLDVMETAEREFSPTYSNALTETAPENVQSFA